MFDENRYGLGMNPRDESGTTKAIQTKTYRNPINAPPYFCVNYNLGSIISYWFGQKF